MYKVNKDTAKHAAQTLRIMGIAQFIHYGAVAFNTDDWETFLLSGGVFLLMEFLGGFVMEKAVKEGITNELA